MNGSTQLYGESAHTRQIRETIDRIAPYDTNVLILGETGTGKELVANEIHHRSRRKAGKIVTVNCSALPENLIESELFGYVRGAFTGAAGNRQGAFAVARGGTLFLDEIGTMKPELQPKLLRALESGRIRQLGSWDEQDVDTRIISATNHVDIYNSPQFRRDLFYRLANFIIELRPLRERPEDIKQIAEVYVDWWNKRNNHQRSLSPKSMSLLQSYEYPGNVRELQFILERACIEADDDVIDNDLLERKIQEMKILSYVPQANQEKQETSTGNHQEAAATQEPDGSDIGRILSWNYSDAVAKFKAAYIMAALRETGGNVSAAARLMKMARSHLFRMIGDAGYNSTKEFYAANGVPCSRKDYMAAVASESTPQPDTTQPVTIEPVTKLWEGAENYIEERIASALRSCGNPSDAARQLGIPRKELYETIKSIGTYKTMAGFCRAHDIQYRRR